MDQTDHSAGVTPEAAQGPAPSIPQASAIPPHAPPLHPYHGSFALRELPFVVVLALTLFGVAYASFSHQPIVGYWEFLAPVIGLLCVVMGWPHAPDRAMRLRLIWTQLLHWLAFLVAMNLLLLSGVSSLLSADAVGLTILTLLALGTFVAGVHIQAWQVCVLGIIMALGVPTIAWIERTALMWLLVIAVVAVVVAALWWGARRRG